MSSIGETGQKLAQVQGQRLQAIRDRLDRANHPLLAAAQWGQSFVDQTDAGVAAFDAAVRDATIAASYTGGLLRPDLGVSKDEFDADLLASASRLNSVTNALADFDLKVRRVLGLLPGMERQRHLSGLGNPDDALQIWSALQHVAALALIDVTWVSGLVARATSQALNSPGEQTAFRMTKHRQRKREKLGTVTLTYHESDLETLRALGFLVGRDKHSAADLAAAFEAFQQASMAAAFSGTVEASTPSRFNAGAYLNAWSERVAALVRVNSTRPSEAAAE